MGQQLKFRFPTRPPLQASLDLDRARKAIYLGVAAKTANCGSRKMQMSFRPPASDRIAYLSDSRAIYTLTQLSAHRQNLRDGLWPAGHMQLNVFVMLALQPHTVTVVI